MPNARCLNVQPVNASFLQRDPTLASTLLDGEFSAMQTTLKEVSRRPGYAARCYAQLECLCQR